VPWLLYEGVRDCILMAAKRAMTDRLNDPERSRETQ